MWMESFFRHFPLVGYMDDTFLNLCILSFHPDRWISWLYIGFGGHSPSFAASRCYSTDSFVAPLLNTSLLQMRNPKPVFYIYVYVTCCFFLKACDFSLDLLVYENVTWMLLGVSFSLFNLQINLFFFFFFAAQENVSVNLFVLAPPSVPPSPSRIPSYLHVGSQICPPGLTVSISLYFCSEF